MKKDLLCAVLFRAKNFYLLCINFRRNFLKYLLCVGVKSECSKRPQRVRLDRRCQQRDHKKSCDRPIINSELQKNPKPNYVQATWGIWFKPTQVKKFRHQGETARLSQTALTDDGCAVSAPESAEEPGPALPSKMSQLQQSHLNTKHVPRFFHLETILQANKLIMTFRLKSSYLALHYLRVPAATIKAISLIPCLKIQKCFNYSNCL